MKRILVTGFGPFPGAPFNPTQHIARRLGALRRPLLADVSIEVRLLPTTYAALAKLPKHIRRAEADAVVMFGLAGRRRTVTPERRGVNTVSTLRADAIGAVPDSRVLEPGGPAVRRASMPPERLVAAIRQAGVAAKVSNDAGDYLCNAALYRARASGVFALFVHVPRPRSPRKPDRRKARLRPDAAALDRAAAAVLVAVVRHLTTGH